MYASELELPPPVGARTLTSTAPGRRGRRSALTRTVFASAPQRFTTLPLPAFFLVCVLLPFLALRRPTRTLAKPPTRQGVYATSPLMKVGPLRVIDAGGVDLLGAPIGSLKFMALYIREKLRTCKTALAHLDYILEGRMRCHLHRVSDSACRLQELFRLVPQNSRCRLHNNLTMNNSQPMRALIV